MVLVDGFCSDYGLGWYIIIELSWVGEYWCVVE